jgi:hypothetical protein
MIKWGNEDKPVSDADAKELHDALLDERHYSKDQVFGGPDGEDTSYDKDDGAPLFIYLRRPKGMAKLLAQALPAFQKAATQKSAKRQAYSGSVGFLAPSGGFNFGRVSGFTRHKRRSWKTMLPVFELLNALYQQHCPKEWAMHNAVALGTSEDFTIPNTVFTTGTVNGPERFKCHADDKNLAHGMSVMTVWRNEPHDFKGGYLVLPQWRVAIDMCFSDVLIFDGLELHGNSPFSPEKGFERGSVIAYYQERMQECGSFEDEEEKAKRLVRYPLGYPLEN